MFVLSELFEECNQVKILEVLAVNDQLCIADIVKLTGATKITVTSHINKFLADGIIVKKDKDGRKQFYKLNKNNPKAGILIRLEEVISEERLGDSIKKDTATEIENIVKITSSQTKLDADVSNNAKVTLIAPKTSIYSTNVIDLPTNTDFNRKDDS
jgi:DNA-binding transcriptional ArsR family regulator